MIRILILFAFALSCFGQSFGRLVLIPTATDSATGEMQFREKVANGGNYVGFKAPASIAANVVWTLPTGDGSNGQTLTTNGSGVLSWGTAGGYWSRTATTVSLVNSGDTVSLSGPLNVTGDTTLSGHLFTSASGTKDIGTSANRFQTLFVTNIDAAPTSGTTNYIKTRKFEVVDNTGGVNLWDIQVTSTGIVNNFKIRDNAGTYRLELANREEVTGTTVNEARLNYHTVPLTHNTWDLGTTGKRWKDLYLQGSITGAGGATISGTVATSTLDDISDANNQIVLNAGFRPASDNSLNFGSSGNRIAGIWTNSLTVNTLTYASGTGSTISLYANMAPYTNNNFALGTTSLRWSKVWTTDLDTSGAFTLGGDLTVGGHILSSATTGTKDIGSSTNRFATLYATNIDAAPTSGTTNYVKTRKFEVVDNAGGSTLWDIQVTSNVTTNNFKIRDNSGTYRLELVNKEETTGTTANEARLNYHTVPYAHNTWDLGTSAKRWKDLYLQGEATIAGNASVAGTASIATLDDVSDASNQVVLNAGFRPATDDAVNIGASAKRISGIWTNSLVVNTLTYATGTGSTITLYANMAPFTNNNFALGTSSLRYSKLWVTDLDFSGTCTGCPSNYWTRTVGGGVGSTNIVSQATSADEIVSTANVYPSVANSKELGLSSRRWNTVWGNFGDFASNLNVGGNLAVTGTSALTGNATFSGNILAAANETKTIGSTSNRFDIVYSRRFEAYDGTYSRIVLNNPGAGSNSGNAIAVNNASGVSKFYVSYGGTVSTGPISFNGNIYTSADNTYSLGDATYRLANVYSTLGNISSNLTVGGITYTSTLDDISDANNQVVMNAGLRPATDDAVNIGGSGKRISGIWTNSLVVNTLTYATGTGSTITLYANMAPFTNNNFALGTTSLRYSKLWVTDIDMSGTCTGCPGTMWTRTAGGGFGGLVALISPVTTTDEMATGAVYPLVTNTHSLGVSTRRWANVWATNFDGSGTLNITGTSTLTGNVTFGGNLIPSANETKTLGTTSSRLDIVYSRRFEANDGTYGRIVLNNPGAGSNSGNAIAVNNASGVSKFYVSYGGTVSTGPISLNGDIYTSANNTYSVGDSTNRMANIYSTLGNFSSNLTVGGIAYAGAVIAGTGAPDGYGFFTRSQDGTKEWFAFAYNGAGTYMGSSSNDSLTIRTNNLNRTTWSAAGDITHSYNMTISGNLTVGGTCTGCGAASVWTRNAGGYLYPTTTTDKLMIGGSGTPADMLEVVGGVRLSGHITYSAGATYDIGTGATRARTGYFTNIDVSGTCTGCGGGWTRNGGGYVYPTTTTDIVVVGGSSAPSGAYKLEVQGGGINAAGSIVPGSNVSYALGSSSLIWNVAYISTLRVADRIIGSATNSSGTVLVEGSLGPAANASYDLGEPTGTVQWRDLRLSGYIYVDGYAGLDSGTVTCGSGQAIKSLSFHGGIVTGYVCGAP